MISAHHLGSPPLILELVRWPKPKRKPTKEEVRTWLSSRGPRNEAVESASVDVHVATLTVLRKSAVPPDHNTRGNPHIGVAGDALNRFVFALENERGERRSMHESRLLELFRAMASRAVCPCVGPRELFGVNIRVAGLTRCLQRPIAYRRLCARREMTLRARRRSVLSGEGEATVAPVVEAKVSERGQLMTAGAALRRDLRGELISMRIAVATLAPRSIQAQVEQSEAESLRALLALELGAHRFWNLVCERRLMRVAVDTGDRSMRSFERISRLRLLMVLGLESRRQKAIRGVTGLALRLSATAELRELPEVRVSVAGGAGLKAQTSELGALPRKGTVAARTRNPAMQPFQWESRLVVQILAALGVPNLRPARSVVASLAIGSKFPFVRIAVAVLT